MHRWFAETLSKLPAERGSKLCVIAPRGNAKSTWATLFFPLFVACEKIESNIWIISDTVGQAESHLENIRAEFAENESLREAYPDAVRGARLSGDKLRLGNGVVIQAFSTGQKLRGRRERENRPSLIIVDDPENDEHIVNPEQRAKNWNWFTKALLKSGNLATNVIVVGTALHRECMVCKLMETPGWRSRKFQSVVKWPTRMDLWANWELVYGNPQSENRVEEGREFFERHMADMVDGGEVLWPDYEPLYDLMRMRCEEGHASFECEKQGNPINPELCEFPEHYFADHIWFDEWPTGYDLTLCALDPSKGGDSKLGDYSAIVWMMVKNGLLYVDADLKRRAATEMVSAFVGRCIEWEVSACAVESNAFQDLLAPDIEEEAEKQRCVLPLHLLLNTVNKQVRIRRLEPYLSRRRIRLKRGSPGALLLLNQLQDFPIGDHDDGPDALEMCIRLGASVTGAEAQPMADRIPIDVR